jgi:protein O-GlcNAc transferase
MSPIIGTWDDIDDVRAKFQYRITSLHARWQKEGTFITTDPVQTVEWLHYYLQYHGLSEYNHQVMMANFYSSVVVGLQWIAPQLKKKTPRSSDSSGRRIDSAVDSSAGQRIKVGFMSKFFGEGQPHGLLLEGQISGLPRDEFEVIVFEVPTESESRLNPVIFKSADQVVKLHLVLSTVRQTLASHTLDVLVLADGMSDPLNYFVAMGTRVAPVQCMFWGNPVTTGGSNVDYFISGDRLEMAEGWQEYSEQLVRMEGQAIWYQKTQLLPTTRTNSSDDEEEWEGGRTPDMLIYVCLQSIFKIHPDFIETVQEILDRVPVGHLVFVKGRKKSWTSMLQQRLANMLSQSVYARVHFVSRLSRTDYIRLVGNADVMLHPFPFGGSKTAADGIAVGVPVVCLKTKYLRGRMAYSLFATMEYEETVAETRSQYVAIAVKLGLESPFRRRQKGSMCIVFSILKIFQIIIS